MPFARVLSVFASPRRALLGVLGIVLLICAGASVEQHAVGYNELSHFAQIRAFYHGTPRIDRWAHTTGDRAFYKGHYYGDKAPGLAFFVLPAYWFARTFHVLRDGYGMIHLMVLVGCGLPLLIMLLLTYREIEKSDPGLGAITAVMLGLGTILFPFSTILFSHVFSATLGFAAFLLLRHERARRAEHGDGRWPLVGAGLLCGYAISTEYPLALLVVLLGLYVIWRPRPFAAGAIFGAGVLVGVIPLLLYDQWAFGSPFHLSYMYVAANSSGFLGLGAPSLTSAVKLLVSDRGLFVVTPLMAAGVAGIVILWREGRRMDALVPAVVSVAYFAYNSCYYLPFGGSVPGPRFLITMLPFYGMPLAAAYRRAPLSTLALAACSAATMIAATVTLPILSTYSSTHVWWSMLAHGQFTTRGVTIDMFAGFMVLALLATARATALPRVSRRDVVLAAFCVGSWFALRTAGPALLAHDVVRRNDWGEIVLVVLGIALAIVGTYLARGRKLALLAGIPLIALAVRSLDQTTLALALAAISLALAAVMARPRHVALQ